MRVLFDNNVPAPLRHRLTGHTVDTAKEMGWQELKNGDLLTAAENDGFQVMVTGDKNLAYQQNLEGRTLSLIVLPTIDWTVLKRAPATLVDIAAAVDRAAPGVSRRCLTNHHQRAVRLGLDRKDLAVGRLAAKIGAVQGRVMEPLEETNVS